MLKTKAIKFIKFNILLQPVLMLLGLLSSIFVIRQLGTEIYANVVLLGGITSTVGLLLSFGVLSTVTKLSVEYEDKNIRQAIVFITLFFQMVLILLFTIGLWIFPELFKNILGDFSNNISLFGFAIIIISTILSTVSSSLLIAELDNKITYLSSFFNALLNPIWLIYTSFSDFGLSSILYGLIIINLISSLILFIGSLKYIGKLNLKNINVMNYDLLKKYFKFLGTISFVRIYVYLASLPFLSLVLNYFKLYDELAYLAVILKIVTIIQNIYGIPINKVSGVMFSTAFKDKNYEMMNKLYNLILKYNAFLYSLAFAGLFYFLKDFIEFVYLIKMDVIVLNLFVINILLSAILGVSNFITTLNEHYKIVFITSITSIIVFQIILWTYVSYYGLYAIALAMILNTLIYSGVGMIYVAKKYKMIHIPFDFLRVLVVAMLVTLSCGYFVENYILSLIFNVILFLVVFYFLYKVKDDEKKLLKDFIPNKIYKFLPLKYRMNA
ncbi:lipopolysaccharide biosynthesis protein [Aliarcobacter cryaerophilus]|uniref:lipopolysaccharide biosynthesis protein n=1 Tax=Aliarcobacter cryaerophilus TaxID=28198 RepID=UPI0021B50D75|nr:hypothetical protein [Aliarcobacter cryaerophilus]MCT7492524.1 hypothetical protein [Aliarcobacter cryaerophilus]